MMDNTERAMTIGEFCHAENISKATYYKLKRKGLGPEETFVPVAGLSLVRLSPVARRRWHATLAELRETKAARPLGQERPGSQDEHLPYRCRPGHSYIGVDAGEAFPLDMLESRVRCPRCGGRRIQVVTRRRLRPPLVDD